MSIQSILRETLIWIELAAALVGLAYWSKLKNSYWKWFALYLCVIFIIEAFSKWGLKSNPSSRVYLYDFIGIPIQFLFFYWLYAIKSLKNYPLFWACTIIYILSFIPYFTLFAKKSIVYSLSYTVGNVLLMLMVFSEIFKQVKSDKILLFRSNFMFYINLGIMLFYIGTLPFFSFYGLILKDFQLWSSYYVFFMVANHIMYLSFISAFVWGKPNTF
ncbi:MAG: hypothetical protein ACQUHE_07300 [Bacteroidia bacterium]